MASSLLDKMETTHQQNPSATSGWNDPPPSNNVHNQTNNNRFHLQRLRRPVDPSIQSVEPQEQRQKQLSAPPNINFHQSRSFPQLNSSGHLAGIGTHPESAFTPTSAINHLISNANSSQSQSSLISSQNNLAANPPIVAFAFHSHPHSNPNLPVASSPSIPFNLHQPQPVAAPVAIQSIPSASQDNAPVQQIAPIMGHHHHYDINNQRHPLASTFPLLPTSGSLAQQSNFEYTVDQQNMPQIPNNIVASIIDEPSTNGSHQHNSIIFSPPNIVPLRGVDQQCRPTTQPIPNDYRIPIKAAGDVSLSGGQLTAFLTKATLLLPQGPMREGIQLRINQFGEFVQSGQISEPCLKKLNFVVDAIDRRIYDEAWQFFEQMLAVYPNDCNTGGWAHGVRLLIQELRKGQLPSRAHSAGTRNF